MFVQFVYIPKRELDYNRQCLYSSLLCYDNFCTKTDTGEKIKYNTPSKNTQQENTKKTTEINWD